MYNESEIIEQSIARMNQNSTLIESTLDELRNIAIRITRTECPVCSSYFHALFGCREITCPFCGTKLVQDSVEVVGHDAREFDSFVPDAITGGEFHMTFVPEGMRYCGKCDAVIPKAYSCCPKLLVLAIKMYREYVKIGKQGRVLDCIQKHRETFLASLRSMIYPELNKKGKSALLEIGKVLQLDELMKNRLED